MRKREQKAARAREATRRWRAKQRAGLPTRVLVPASPDVTLHEIPGFSNYRVDQRGQLYSRLPLGKPRYEDGQFVPWRVMTVQFDPGHRYWTARVRADDAIKRKRVMLHYLVALAFLGPRPPGMFVAHGTGGPLDNSPGNLSYKTPAQNKADELRDGTRYHGARHHEVKRHTKRWPELVRRWNAGIERKTDLCREFGISRQAVMRRLQRADPYRRHFAGTFEALILGG